MAEPAYHYAIGMICSSVASAPLVLFRTGRRLLLLAPAWISLAGLWALLPDIPQIWREFPSLPFYETLSDMNLKTWFHRRPFGDLFFFHATIDRHVERGSLQGLAVILLLYNFFVVAYIAYFWATRRRSGPVPLYDDPLNLPEDRPVRLRPGPPLDVSLPPSQTRETPPSRAVPPASAVQTPRRPRPGGTRPH